MAVCSVRLPAGCLPPRGPVPMRIASGCGATDTAAAFKAQAEAVERYSLQYADTRPESLAPVRAFGGPPDPADIAELALGAPHAAVPVTSRGAAAGSTIDQAIEAAALEYLEHHHLDDRPGLDGFAAVDPAGIRAVAPHVAFLDAQFRRLTVAVLASPFGYHVARAVCCDRSGARPTLGSAADIPIERAVLRATEEAILAWRNMIEIERMGSLPLGPDGTPDRMFRIHRHLDAIDTRVLPDLRDPAPPPDVPVATRLHQVTGRRVRFFDMTVPEIGAPVAKVLVG